MEKLVPLGLLVGGEWVDARTSAGRDTIEVLDPGTGMQIAEVPEAGVEDVDAAVASARAAWPKWRDLAGTERGVLLSRLADLVEAHADDIALVETLDNGKPLSAARGHDVVNAVATLRHFARLAAMDLHQTVDAVIPRRNSPRVRVDRVPLGVVAGLIPWNAPFMAAVWKLAPAVAFGNTVVLKPAEETPLGTLLLAKLVGEAGFPPGVVSVLPGRGATTGALLARHPGVDKISFTGSTEVGHKILAESAVDFRRVGLELGGKSATLLFADAVEANAKRAATTALWAVFANSGQVCSAASRLLVERPVYQQVVEVLVGMAGSIPLGHGLDDGVQLGPLISEQQRGRVHAFVSDPASPQPVVGGQPLDRPGFFYPPTIVEVSDRDVRIWNEEVFGPVLCMTPFDDPIEAVAIANNSQYGLSAGLITADEERAGNLAARLEVGTVWVNTHNQYDPAVPWGGMKHSGIGRELGSALSAYTEEKVTWFA